MNPALNWLRIITPRAWRHTAWGIAVEGVAMNPRVIASHVSTRTTRSDLGVTESFARTDVAPKMAIRGKRSSFFIASWLKQGDDDLESADWRWFRMVASAPPGL